MPYSHSNKNSKSKHGGQLKSASEQYGIPLENWVDLSTGINPTSYPLPEIPAQCWQRLPEINDGLEDAAESFYGSPSLLPVSGSQEAIQCLPMLFPITKKVGVLTPAYQSHMQAWQDSGHTVIPLSSEDIKQALPSLDILIIVNPCNPSCESFDRETLLGWHQQLQKNNGTLIVDEAFIDATPENSLIRHEPLAGLIVLRSIGKFFGLAGIRLGFVWAEQEILQALEDRQDDWSVSHPARWAGKIALQDNDWQHQQKKQLSTLSQRLVTLLEDYIFTKPLQTGGVYFNTMNEHVLNTHLFAYFQHPRARYIHKQLAKQGVLTRLFEDQPALRFGLPANEKEWEQLTRALNNLD